MRYELEQLKQIAHGLAMQFGESCEIVIHDVKAKEMEGTVVCIENGAITNRQVGDGPSHVVLEAIKNDGKDVVDRYGYLTKTQDGRVFRSTTIYLRDEDGAVAYAFCINSDVTDLVQLQQIVNKLAVKADVSESLIKAPAERITNNVSDLLDDLLDQAVHSTGTTPALMTKTERMQAVKYLNDAGAFLISKSADKIADFFGISKFTLYSDLNAIKDQAVDQ